MKLHHPLPSSIFAGVVLLPTNGEEVVDKVSFFNPIPTFVVSDDTIFGNPPITFISPFITGVILLPKGDVITDFVVGNFFINPPLLPLDVIPVATFGNSPT